MSFEFSFDDHIVFCLETLSTLQSSNMAARKCATAPKSPKLYLPYFSCHPGRHWPTSGPQPHQLAPADRWLSPEQSCCQCRSAPADHSCSAGRLPDDGG